MKEPFMMDEPLEVCIVFRSKNKCAINILLQKVLRMQDNQLELKTIQLQF